VEFSLPGLSHKNPPDWLERNIIFRKLFLLRKLYLTRLKFSHYSGAGEDISIRKLFPGDYRGIFVDVGCYHPIKYNHTWALYKKGWRGINIDIDDIKIELFDMVRREDVNIACAVSDKPVMDGYVTREIECKTLTSLIDGTRYKDAKIDFLNVDAEGHDFEVLSSLDFQRYEPSLIAVEIHERTLDRVQDSKLYKLLQDIGYMLVGWCGETLLLANREMQERLKKEHQR
jgi:hypothetical protein